MGAINPGPRTGFSPALLAVGESLLVLAGCLTLSLAVGLLLILTLAEPRYDGELDLQPVSDRADSAGELILAMDSLEFAERVEVAEDGTRVTLICTGLTTRDFPEARVVKALRDSGYRMVDERIKRSYDKAELIRQLGVPMFGAQALIFLVVGGVLANLRSRPVPGGRGAHPAALLIGVGAGLAAFALSWILGLLQGWIGIPVKEQQWVLDLLQDRAELLRLTPWIVLIVPVAEEVFFRGYVFRLLSRRAGLVAGLVISSAMFAAVHLNPTGLVVYFGIGMVLAWIHHRTGSLLAPIAGHVVHNSLVLGLAAYATG
jgi:membrane protease YdiL (CAAX protease family)